MERKGQSWGILAAGINLSCLLTGCWDIGWLISFWPNSPRGSIRKERPRVQLWVVWAWRLSNILLNVELRSRRLKKEIWARKIQVCLEASGNCSSGYRYTCPGKWAEKRTEGNTQTSSPGKPHALPSFHMVLFPISTIPVPTECCLPSPTFSPLSLLQPHWLPCCFYSVEVLPLWLCSSHFLCLKDSSHWYSYIEIPLLSPGLSWPFLFTKTHLNHSNTAQLPPISIAQ